MIAVFVSQGRREGGGGGVAGVTTPGPGPTEGPGRAHAVIDVGHMIHYCS